jgi:uncharacterized protein (DUF305 family)
MRAPRPLLAVLCAALVALAVAGCGGDDGGSVAPSGDVRGNDTDAAFVEAMIPHHESAVDAADLALSHAEHPQLRRLAREMLQVQSIELATLRSVQDVLQQAGIEPGDLGLSEAEQGTDHDAAELRNARNFDCAFIDMMVPHHEGAIRISRAELDSGIHAELRRMSENIIDAQGYEIRQMQRFHRRWCDGAAGDRDHGSGRSHGE